MLCEMESLSSRIWTRVAVSISYDHNHYTTGTSIRLFMSYPGQSLGESYSKGMLSVYSAAPADWASVKKWLMIKCTITWHILTMNKQMTSPLWLNHISSILSALILRPMPAAARFGLCIRVCGRVYLPEALCPTTLPAWNRYLSLYQ